MSFGWQGEVTGKAHSALGRHETWALLAESLSQHFWAAGH